MSAIIEQVKKTIEKYDLLHNGDNIVVGFSGGPDSLCLLHSLCLLKEYFGINKITAVHINHMYRGEAAFEDERFAEEFCRKANIPFFAYRFDIEKLSLDLRMSSEETGRKVRYETFRKVAEEMGGAKIAVAHNKEDQAETLMMRLVRGTGTDGLAGIEYSRDGIIRPLLSCSRKDIEGYCKENNLQPRIDGTNLEPIYTRNLVRLKIIPYINEAMNADIVESLAKLSDIVKEDKEFINEFADSVADKCVIEGERVALERSILKELHPAIRKRVIMKCFGKIGLKNDIVSVHLEAAERLILSERSSVNLDFPHKYVMKCRYDKVYFDKVHINNTITYELLCRIIEKENYIEETEKYICDKNATGYQMFDYDKIKKIGEPILRYRESGDVISPKGFSGRKKLKEYFIDSKIDKDLRNEIPLMCIDKTVLWIYGHEINQNFLPDEGTKRLLEAKIIMK